jgi:general secretion pathway protein D
VAVVKDERLSMLLLMGPEKDVKQAQDFLALIDRDSPAARRTIKYYKLKNAAVKDVVDYVGQLLGMALQARAAERAATGETAKTTAQPVTGATPGTASAPPPVTTPPVYKPTTGTKGTGKGGSGSGNENLPADIIPVEGLNMLVVAGDQTVHQEVEAILSNLDRRKGQVLIEVAIVQVTGDDSMDLGVEGLGLNALNSDKKQLDYGTGFGIGTQSDTATRGFPTQTALSALSGGALRFVNQDKLQVVLSALASKSNVSIVSQPQLLVNDNEQAEFTTKVSEPTTMSSQGTATTNTSFNGYADATTSLKITPHISPDHYLNLEVVQTFEEFTGGSTSNGVPPPKVSNNATTKISVPDRQTIVIGGFTRDSSTNSRSGIPGLMSIPGIGKVFSKESKSKTSSRLYLFVRPKILSAPDFADLQQASDGKKNDVERLSKSSRIDTEMKGSIGREEPRAEVVPDK